MQSMDNSVDTRRIALPKGGTLEVEMTTAFVDALRKHYGLDDAEKLDDDHVRMYVWGAVNTATDKAEKDAHGTSTI